MFKRNLAGSGIAEVPARRQAVWDVLLDPVTLARLIPGDPFVELLGPASYRAVISFGVGPCTGHYDARLVLSSLEPPQSLTLSGGSSGAFGTGRADARVSLRELGHAGTEVSWAYESQVSGPISLVGSTLLNAATRLFVQRFFNNLAGWPFGGASGGLG
jgi:2-furoyl-CoA dehydrogenase large subunit